MRKVTELQRKRRVDTEKQTTMNRITPEALTQKSIVNNINDLVSSGGQSLDAETLTFMESRFGHDFGEVKIHHNSTASESAKKLSANAYTIGSDIVFATGKYSPNTTSGKRLIAHELTHVIQQANVSVNQNDGLTIGIPGSTLEQSADKSADTIIGDGYVNCANQVTSQPIPSVQREEDSNNNEFDTWLEGLTSFPDLSDVSPEVLRGATQEGLGAAKTGLEYMGYMRQGLNFLTGELIPTTDEEGFATGELEEAGIFTDNGLIGNTLDIAGRVLNVGQGMSEGQHVEESLFRVASEEIADYAVKGTAFAEGGVGRGLGTLGNIAEFIGSPQWMQDGLSVSREVISPSALIRGGASQAMRLGYNVLTGNDGGVLRQSDEMLEGRSGSSLQGYALMGQALETVISGQDVDVALGDRGANSSAGRIGRGLGDTTYDFVTNSRENASDSYSNFDRQMQGLTGSSDRSALLGLDEFREEAWQQGNYFDSIGAGIAEGAIGTVGALGGLGSQLFPDGYIGDNSPAAKTVGWFSGLGDWAGSLFSDEER